jgi:hypothetical protein
VEPITSAQLLTAGSHVLGQALGGAKSPGLSSADSGQVWANFDHSGWTVSYGSAGVLGGGSSPSVLMLAGLAFAAWYLWKKS